MQKREQYNTKYSSTMGNKARGI